jgi:hypothetical protein
VNVGPERRIGAVHRQTPEEAVARVVQSGVEPVRRRDVQLGELLGIFWIRLILSGVVDENAEVRVHGEIVLAVLRVGEAEYGAGDKDGEDENDGKLGVHGTSSRR